MDSKQNLLEYENQIFLDAFQEDGLLILARGLGMERIFSSFLKLYSDPGNLVLVLNTRSYEEEMFLEQLQVEEVNPLPKVVTTNYSAADRQSLYLEGGVLFMSSRILVVDMLTKKLPTHLVSGILVYNAHRIIDSCQEGFILRLFRQISDKGFIKAFSSQPTAFTAGFCHVERVMKSLFVRKLFLWPRFHASVISYFDRHKVDVVELHLKMTPSMVACQMCLLDLIDACTKELKICNPSLDTDEITVEYAITRGFDKIIKLYFDQVWHQLGGKTKQIVADIKTLRLVLEYLTQYDCVSFFNLVHSIRSSEKAFSSNSGWMFMDSADSLYVHAKERVYFPVPTNKKQKTDISTGTVQAPKPELNLEECPKWQALKDILEEIKDANKEQDPEFGNGRVLVAAQDDRTCSQIKEYICDGGKSLLSRLYNKTIAANSGEQKAEDTSKGKSKFGSSKGKGPMKGKGDSDTVTLTQLVKQPNEREEPEDKDDSMPSNKSSDAYYGVISSPVTVLHPLHGTSNPYGLLQTLQELEPTYVILYDSDITFVRQLEVFKASRPGLPLRVYFLMYTGSTEEQRYLTTLRKEKEAFEYLIKEKATMVIPTERDGRFEGDPNLSRDTAPANATTNTRKGGAASSAPSQPAKIIVDMREFRSELPSLIHRRGIDIEPVTIEVGDYILTPDICVERKSVSDLIGSLNNGRLYNQCVSMCRFYRRPVLLIEFDPNKPFSLQGKSALYGEMSSNDVQARLALLTLHFPRLRILWCQSPYVTAELFEALKTGREQPDTKTAMAITGETEVDLTSGKYNHNSKEMLLKMPGITTRNVFAIMNQVENLADLVKLSEEQLGELMSNVPNAKLLYQFLHCELSSTVTSLAESEQRKQKKGFKRKR